MTTSRSPSPESESSWWLIRFFKSKSAFELLQYPMFIFGCCVVVLAYQSSVSCAKDPECVDPALSEIPNELAITLILGLSCGIDFAVTSGEVSSKALADFSTFLRQFEGFKKWSLQVLIPLLALMTSLETLALSLKTYRTTEEGLDSPMPYLAMASIFPLDLSGMTRLAKDIQIAFFHAYTFFKSPRDYVQLNKEQMLFNRMLTMYWNKYVRDMRMSARSFITEIYYDKNPSARQPTNSANRELLVLIDNLSKKDTIIHAGRQTPRAPSNTKRLAQGVMGILGVLASLLVILPVIINSRHTIPELLTHSGHKDKLPDSLIWALSIFIALPRTRAVVSTTTQAMINVLDWKPSHDVRWTYPKTATLGMMLNALISLFSYAIIKLTAINNIHEGPDRDPLIKAATVGIVLIHLIFGSHFLTSLMKKGSSHPLFGIEKLINTVRGWSLKEFEEFYEPIREANTRGSNECKNYVDLIEQTYPRQGQLVLPDFAPSSGPAPRTGILSSLASIFSCCNEDSSGPDAIDMARSPEKGGYALLINDDDRPRSNSRRPSLTSTR